MPPRPNAPWHFDFPHEDGIHYVTTRSGPIKDHSAMRMRFRIVGDATFKATQGDAPARVRLYMQRRGDNMRWDHASYRFWSRPLDLATGEYTLLANMTKRAFGPLWPRSRILVSPLAASSPATAFLPKAMRGSISSNLR
jgi:hypothetical protein